ncbi:RNA ligase [Lacrimispora amygdalina]|uniref:RNA ligase n=1 Tax=Lacrimispora amygdalina TaxID=253257 RepID=UPI000BE38E9C|nr:RNA ligase [Lacrimispora amygdalina]
MRKLLVLRGVPGSGKSTWIKQNNLEEYTLSSDHIRTLFQAPSLNGNGERFLYDYENEKVWRTLTEMLEARMGRGEFIIVDATNTTSKEILKYKVLADKYRYRIYCVDFSNVPLKIAKERNEKRNSLSRVPESVIDKMYNRLQLNLELPSGVQLLKPDEFDKVLIHPLDFSSYKKIHHIGDIHGCYTVLMEYLKNGLKEDEYYIFTGDYIDRGIENAEVLNFIMSIADKRNILLIEGNHERWLRMWSNGEISLSKEFEDHTKKQLEKDGVKRKQCRSFCRKLTQCAFYRYNDKTFVVSHAGISTVPGNLLFISTKQLIEGVGGYQDVETIENTFDRKMPSDFYQIHGHRNRDLPVHSTERNYNLEGQVELGGYLRCVQVDRDGIHTVETKNNVFRKPDTIDTVAAVVNAFRKDEDIKEKKFGNISSFNFTRDAFNKKRWNERTVTARGLYINTKDNSIVAKGYDKFFAVEETEYTSLSELKKTFKFPVTGYVKENGYLGIIGFNKEKEDLFITTKSDPSGIAAQGFKELFMRKTTEEVREEMAEFIRAHDVTFLFEVVDVENDPHIIDYSESEIYLLDIVENKLDFEKMNYSALTVIAERFKLKVKKLAYIIHDWNEFVSWYEMVTASDFKYKGNNIEGFVLEDQNEFMVKVKLSYYREWKYLRGIKDRILAGYDIPEDKLTPMQKDFCDFISENRNDEKIQKSSNNICGLRKLFLEEKINNKM